MSIAYSNMDVSDEVKEINNNYLFDVYNSIQEIKIDNDSDMKHLHIIAKKGYYDICKNYIISLYWILGYYNGHCHENWDWYYDHYATPFVSDLFSYLSGNFVIQNIKFKKTKPVTTLEQLCMVLPKDSLLEIVNSIDDELYKKMKRIFNTRDIITYYPNEICLDMINKQYLWQSKIFLKTFNSEIINILL